MGAALVGSVQHWLGWKSDWLFSYLFVLRKLLALSFKHVKGTKRPPYFVRKQ